METYFLVYTLIESNDCISDGHTLYRYLEDAKAAMEQEIKDCEENFLPGSLEDVISMERIVERRNEDGYGFTVGIEQVTPL